MKISWIQYDIKWLDVASNLNKLTEIIERSDFDDVELLVLPEMFDTGFAMNPEKITNRDQNDTINWMNDIAKKYSMGVMGSIIYHKNDLFYNRLIYTDGELIHTYDKIHLFTLSGEHKVYQKGKKVIDFSAGDITIRPLICYDLRFPEISRNRENFDILIYVASWPRQREEQWYSLLKARAIENQCYVLGVNRIGEDGNQLKYSGKSVLFSFDGSEILCSESEEGFYLKTLKVEEMYHYRRKLPFLSDI